MSKSKFVIYDQFHWQRPDHLVELVTGRDEALARYKHWKTFFPGESYGLLSLDKFKRLEISLFGKTQFDNIKE